MGAVDAVDTDDRAGEEAIVELEDIDALFAGVRLLRYQPVVIVIQRVDLTHANLRGMTGDRVCSISIAKGLPCELLSSSFTLTLKPLRS